MTNICPSCGAEIPHQFIFCGICGESIKENTSSQSSNSQTIKERSSRRLAIVLFADLVNFTRAAEGVDPEIVYRTIRNTLENLAKIIKELEGRVDRYYGDGFLATFGIPDAHEDDHERALKAALDMQHSMIDLRSRAKTDLNWDMQLRIGINVGPVIRGQLDTGLLQDTSVFGHAVNLASRLQSAARPGTILVNEEVYLKTRNKFSFQDPVRLQLKGIDKPVIAYELNGTLSNPEPSRGLKGRTTYFIGREIEVNTLVKRLERLRTERQGSITLISGEAGIGKSRLVDEVLPKRPETLKVIRGQGSPFHSSNYAFISDIIKKIEDISLSEFKQTYQETDLWLSTNDEPVSDPQEHQRRIIAYSKRIISELVKRRPLIMLFDDFQWADQSSIEVISHIIDLTNEFPLSIILVIRSSLIELFLDFLTTLNQKKTDHFIIIQLQSLTVHESNSLVEKLIPEVKIPLELKSEIFLRSGGNPLFTEELVRAIIDEFIVQYSDDHWMLDSQWEKLFKKIPTSINGLLLNRYDRQSPEYKIILDMASIIGQKFHISLLAKTIGIPEIEIIHKVDQLEHEDLLRRSMGFSSPTYSFRHALMQEAIYETILLEDRKSLHKKVADTLKNVADEYFVNANAVIGYHFEKSGSQEAINYLIKAANQSAQRYANIEAITYYKRAQKLLDHVETYRPEMVDVVLGLGSVLNRVGKSELAQDQLLHALEAINSTPHTNYRLGDVYYQLGHAYYERGQLMDSLSYFEQASHLLDTSPNACTLFDKTDTERELGWIYWNQGKIENSLTHAENALSLAQSERKPNAAGSAHKLLASIYFWNGNIHKSIKNAEESLKIREQIGDIWKAASSQTTLGYFYHQIGEWSLAEKMLRQAIFVQKELGDFQLLASSWSNLGLLLLDKGEFDEALECMNEAINIFVSHDFPLSLATNYYINRGITFLRIWDNNSALKDFEQGLAGAIEQANDDLCALSYSYMAETTIKMNDFETAEEFINKAIETLGTSKSNEIRREIFRIRSYIKRETQDFEAALSFNAEALNLIVEAENKYENARLQIDKANIYLASNDDRNLLSFELRTEVENALKTFQELNAQKGTEWAEEILYQIESLRSDIDAKPNESVQFPTSVIDIHINLPVVNGYIEEPDEKLLKIQKILATELSGVTNKPNIFLVTTPTGFAFVLTTINQTILEEKFAIETINVALSSISAVVRINKSIRNKFGHVIKTRIGVSIGTSTELVKNHEQAAMFASISQSGRHAHILSQQAPPFQILLTGDIPGVIFESFKLKEFPIREDKFWQTCLILGEAKSPQALSHALPRSTDKLIGRKDEFEAIKSLFDRIASEPYGQVIYIEAEAGMGKTRLLKEIKAYSQSNIQFLHGKCEAFRRTISYWPFIEILNGSDYSSSTESNHLKSMLGVKPPDENNKNLLQNLPAESLRKEIFSSTSEFLISQTSNDPIVLVIEDIHDIDLSTLDVIDYLFPKIFEAPISIMLIARSEMPGPHRSLVKKAKRVCQDRFLQIELTGLTQEETFKLVKEMLGTSSLPAQLSKHLTPFIGHPLSAEEVVRFSIEGGLLWKTNNTWKMGDITKATNKVMPTTFRDLLLERLELLDHDSLHVLQASALLGETFDQIILERMITDSSLAQRLSELTQKCWLQKSSNGNPLHFKFNHTLTRETIYSTLVRSKKQLLHQRAGEAIEDVYSESIEENYELLAYHFENSSLPDKSLHYLIRAAEKCAHNYSLDESRGYFNKARAIIFERNLTNSRTMIRVTFGLADIYVTLGEANQVQDVIEELFNTNPNLPEIFAIACYRRLGSAAHLQGNLSAAIEKFTQALEIADKIQDTQHQLGGQLIVSAFNERIEILIGMAKVFFDSGKYQKADDTIRDLLKDLPRKQNYEKTAELYNVLAGIAFRTGKFDSAQQLTEKGLSCYRTNNNRSKASSAYSNLGVLASLQQDFIAGYDYFSLALDIQTALGEKSGIAVSTNNLGQLELNRGNQIEAKIFLEKSIETARRSELLRSLAQGLSNLGFVHTISGELDTAIDHLSEAKTLCYSHQYLDLLSENYWKLAEYFAAIDVSSQKLGVGWITLHFQVDDKLEYAVG